MAQKKFNRGWSLLIIFVLAIILLAVVPSRQQLPINFIERESGQLKTEKVAGENWLVWLYNNPVGEATLWIIAKRKAVSTIYGSMMDKASSTKKIEPFVKEYNIDLGISIQQEFTSFNDFFTRKLKKEARPVDTAEGVLISPADGKVFAYNDISDTDFIIKGHRFNVYSFLNDSALAEKYLDGAMIVVRLAPNDYHRFHFPFSGKVLSSRQIKGDYYSVNPIALREVVEIFCLNKREITILDNPLIGETVYAEVGATMVGSIIQTYKGNDIRKGQEKGYFKFGGSTVVLLFQKDKIVIDSDLIINSSAGFETSIQMGEQIARMIIR